MTAPTRTALLVVDMQVDFVAPTGRLSVPGATEIIPVIKRLVIEARGRGELVCWSLDHHPAVTPHFKPFGGPWPIHCVAGSAGAELVPELAAQRQPHDPVVYKGSEGEDGYSAFSLRDPRSGRRSATPLHALLQRQGVTALQLCGVATDWCVRATALDAVRLGYRVHLVDTAIAAVNLTPSDGTLAIEEMLASGVERVTGPARGSRSTAPR